MGEKQQGYMKENLSPTPRMDLTRHLLTASNICLTFAPKFAFQITLIFTPDNTDAATQQLKLFIVDCSSATSIFAE